MVEKAAYFHIADGISDKTLQARDICRLTVPGSVRGEAEKHRIGFARGGLNMVENNTQFGFKLTYQDARMATAEEFKESLIPFSISKTGSCAGGPVLYRDGDVAYCDPSELHTMIIGDTGSTKTLRFVQPLIRSCAYAGESMVIVDPKGSLCKESRPILEKYGYKAIHVLDFRNPDNSPDCWNPLDSVAAAAQRDNERGKDIAFQRLADVMEVLFFKRLSGNEDPYWIEAAGQYALGISQGFIEAGSTELLTIDNIIRLRHSEDELKMICKKLPHDSEAYNNISSVVSLGAEKTKSCILATFDQLTRIFMTAPGLTKMLSEQSFRMSQIGERKTAIFVVVPDEKTTYHFLAKLFISQCYTMLLEAADRKHGRLKNRVNIILEEFCNIPKISDILPMMTAARSRNIRLHLVIQSYGQMVEKYEEDASRAIMDNCGNWIYLHTREYNFLKYMSDVIGRDGHDHPLLSTSQLQHLKKNETLILHDRCYPIVVQDVPLIFEYGS